MDVHGEIPTVNGVPVFYDNYDEVGCDPSGSAAAFSRMDELREQECLPLDLI